MLICGFTKNTEDGVHEKLIFRRENCLKMGYALKGKLRQFADLSGGLGKKEVGCLWGEMGLIPQCTLGTWQ